MVKGKVEYATDHPLFDIHSYDLDLNANHIFLMGNEEAIINEYLEGSEPGVEYSMANRFVRNLNILTRRSKEPILIHMKTNGGVWEEGMAIYDAIKTCPNNICILNYTHARSMSSLIFTAADRRVMMPHSVFMFHDGTMGLYGTVKQYFTEAEQLKKTGTQMMKIYVDAMRENGKYTKWSRKRIETWLRSQMDKKEEVYLDAEETVDLGFADGIFGVEADYNWDTILQF